MSVCLSHFALIIHEGYEMSQYVIRWKPVLCEASFYKETRKSFCVNARGIPTAAYQVLLRWGTRPPARSDRGVPKVGYPPVRVPPRPGLLGGYPRWGIPHWSTAPTGLPPCRGTSPGQGTPLVRVPPRLDLAGVPPPHLDLAWVPPPPGCGQTDGQTRVKT